jgi:hypothetical protein
MKHRALWAGVGAIVIVALFAFPGTSAMSAGPGAAFGHPIGVLSAPAVSLGSAPGALPTVPQPVSRASIANPPILQPVPTYRLPTAAVNPSVSPSTSTQSPRITSSSGPTALTPAPAAPNTYRTAIFTGYVDDARTGRPIIGATIDWESQGGICPGTPGNCSSTRTYPPYGNFSIRAPAPQVTVLATENGYLTNFTAVANVTPGQVYAVGTINLTKEGIVTGLIEGSDPTHELVKCTVLISSVSRSSFTIGANITVSNGHFALPVPPFPSVVSFGPKCPQYQSTEYWVNVSAYSTFNLPIAYLPVNVLVQVEEYDAVTHQALKQSVIPGSLGEIQVCAYNSPGTCGNKGPAVSNGAPEAWAPPGYDTVTAWSYGGNLEGAAVNTTMIGYVPPLAPGHVFNAGKVYSTDLGLLSIDVGFTYQRQLTAEKVLQKWPVGEVVVTPSSLDGLNAWSAFTPNPNDPPGNFSTGGPPVSCVNPDSAAEIYAPPLRDTITIRPDSSPTCAPPYPTWPIPTYLPALGNETIANVSANNNLVSPVTPNRWLNLTPGTYVEGGIYGSGATPVGQEPDEQSLVSFSDVTTDQTQVTLATPSFTTEPTASTPIPNHPDGFDPAGCVSSWYIFCVPVPFGPSVITAVGTSISNDTWIDIPPGFYNGGPMLIQNYDTAPLVHVNANGVQVPPKTANSFGAFSFSNSSVTGRVLVNGTNIVPYGLITIVVSPAGTPPSQESTGTCTASPTGSFVCSANPGWNEVEVTGPLYLVNYTWVYVNGENSQANAGTILLTPLATIEGQVVTPAGVGILQASAMYCPLSSQTASSCSPIGPTGVTNSYGQYWGLVPAYPTPRGDYKLTFSATGFTANWTWVSVTQPGEIVNASTITMSSETTGNSSGGIPPAAGGAPALTEWVDGNVTDNVTGLPVQGLTGQWQTPGGLSTSLAATDINALDDYNTSIPIGYVYLNFSAVGYYPASVFMNVTGYDPDAVDYLSTITMQPFTFFSGRVEIGPGNWSNVSTQDGIGPPLAGVQACTSLQLCGSTFAVDLGGFFNISGPIAPKQFEVITILPTYTTTGAAQASYTGVAIAVHFPGSPAFVSETVIAQCYVFGIAVGQVFDASTNNSTPVRWPSATLYNGIGSLNQTSMISGGGGVVMALTFQTQGKSTLSFSAQASAYLPNSYGRATIGWGQTAFVGNVSLPHYGWIAGFVDSTIGHNTTVPWAAVRATTFYGSPPLPTSNPGTANGAGYVNLTVPPGIDGTLNVSAPDYNSSSATGFGVNQSQTDSISTLLSAKTELGGLEPWGWIQGNVSDNSYGFPLELASVQSTSRYGAVGESGITTNGAGHYFIDAPPGPSDNVSINLTDYIGNWTKVSVTPGGIANAHLVNLTGYGVVAGYVVAFPSGEPVAYANVSLCPQKDPLCSNTVQANGSGYFWLAGLPGLDNLTVSYPDFVTTFQPVNVSSDQWIFIGPVSLNEYAFLSGAVIGLPSGIPVDGANVSTCSPLAFSEGAVICPYVTRTTATGQFFLAVPAANYILQVNATLYNTSFLPIQLSPGESVSMGLIELQQYGIATGYVYGEDTQGPLAGATVTACPTWEVGNCTSARTNPKTGQYLVEGPPGPYFLTAAAPSYDKAGEVVDLISGNLVKAPTIYLEPIGPSYRFTIQGTVLAQSPAPGGAVAPYAGALISDNVGDTATTNAQGQFSLSVTWGDIVITVTADGYRAAQLSEAVRGNITGVSVTLQPMTYLWSGYITDGINRQPLEGVNLTLGPGGLVIATSTATGLYSVSLPNGTFDLDAGFPAGSAGASSYPTVPVPLTVNGAAGTLNIALYPPQRTLLVQVVNRASGVPIANAAVVASGATDPENVGLTVPGTTNVNGSVGIEVYTGLYNVTASASGYLTSTVTADATIDSATVGITVELASIAVAAPPAGNSGITPAIGAALAGGVVVLAAGVYLFTRRLSAAPRSAPNPSESRA